MLSLIIALLIWIALSLAFLPIMHPVAAVIVALFPAIGALIYITRKMMNKLQPIMLQAQKQAQAKQFSLAIKTLESLLPMAKWQIMLKSQINSQIGMFLYADKKEDKALEYLEKGSPRAPDSQMILASMYFKKKDAAKVKEVFDITIRVNKKQVLLYNAYAFMLNASDDKEGAIAALQKGLKVNADNDATKDNLLRLQNNKKLNMKPFGMPWYSLQLEKPPMSMMQQQFAGKAGFRKMKKGR
ncbi:MAG: hypothetical protein HQL32_12245 [Planctomycetes bacterium]|nr:hypothetical protein [Planctomycetota bacterium]